MAIDIKIALGSPTPIYWQIVEQVTKAVADGALKAGDQLPSVRALAERLVINPNTVARAYNDLVREGVVESLRGKGLYIAERRQVFSEEELQRRFDQALDVFLHEVRVLGIDGARVLAAVAERLPSHIREAALAPVGRLPLGTTTMAGEVRGTK